MRTWIELFTALGYGAASAWLPVLNTEVFLTAAIATRIGSPFVLAASVGTGLAIGKMAMFHAVRAGRRLPALARADRRPAPPAGTWRARWVTWSRHAAHLVEDPRWGLPIMFASASSGVPPLYLTTVLAGASRMRFTGFALTAWAGMLVRYLVIAAVLTGVLDLTVFG